ncbi:unnamed protein product [Pararhodospirillum photometricum DSM 122]|uniref:Uncharacterized protein n=1 Tax=Pararhodospirillum photometricum DSM 122 TaxID=1150469 RepID=H6SNB7_PARPM|nr:unnamed protein product [Pararhodospirillum photometricum DSM 122]
MKLHNLQKKGYRNKFFIRKIIIFKSKNKKRRSYCSTKIYYCYTIKEMRYCTFYDFACFVFKIKKTFYSFHTTFNHTLPLFA